MSFTVVEGVNLLDEAKDGVIIEVVPCIPMTIEVARLSLSLSLEYTQDNTQDIYGCILHPYWTAVDYNLVSGDDYAKLKAYTTDNTNSCGNDVTGIVMRIYDEYLRRLDHITNRVYEKTKRFTPGEQEEFESSESILEGCFEYKFRDHPLKLSPSITNAINDAKAVSSADGVVEEGTIRDEFMLSLASIESQIKDILSGY